MNDDYVSGWILIAVITAVALLALGAWAGMWIEPLAPDVSL